MSLRPWFASEVYGPTPYRNCRGSSGFFATMVATNNEANLNAYGRPRGRRARTLLLKRMWRAFVNQDPPDSNMWADQGDVHLMHVAAFPDLPLPQIISSGGASDLWDDIGPNAVSLAIDTSAVPASDPVRRYVGPVAHQGVAWQKRTRNRQRQVRWMDPMHPPSDRYIGHWVPWASLRKAAKAIEPSGRFFYELYPAGEWTDAARVRRKLWRANAALQEKDERIDKLIDRRTFLLDKVESLEAQTKDFSKQITALEAQIIDLEQQIARLEAPDEDCAAEVAAALDAAEDAVLTALRSVRTP